MAIKYTWKITAMKKAPSMDDLSDVITGINFEYKGVKGTGASAVEGTFNGACPIAAPDKDNFTALADLKEADVIVWAKASHPVEHMNEVIAKQIADQETPKSVDADMPWAPAPETPVEE